MDENELALRYNELRNGMILLLVAIDLNDEGDEQDIIGLATELKEENGLIEAVAQERKARELPED